MSGRRSHSRFVVATQWDGSVRVLHDVMVDRAGAARLLVVCHAPGVRDEVLSLELMGEGRALALSMTVHGSRPIMVNGALRHRVELSPAAAPVHGGVGRDDGSPDTQGESQDRCGWPDLLDSILDAPDRVAVLGRVVPVRVVDISASGCLLESGRRLEKDVSGVLRILVDGEHYTDDIRVVRAGPGLTTGLHQFGGQFLWTTSPGEHSLRRVVAKLQGATHRSLPLPPPAPGLGSGSPGSALPISKSDAWRPLRNPSKP